MKKKILCALVICACLALSACQAEDINGAVNALGQDVGVDVNLNLEQEQVDAVIDKAEEVKDGVVSVVTDEEVQSAAGSLFEALKKAIEAAIGGAEDDTAEE